MSGAEDKSADRDQSDPRQSAERILDEMLRQIGADILDEPVPESLRRLLRPEDGPDEGITKAGGDRRQSRDQGMRRRDDEPSG